MRSVHVSQVIAASPEAVYAYAVDADHLPRWASGLAEGEVTHEDGALVVDSPMGRVRVEFLPHNDFGVLDHDVTLPSGDVVTNPVRVLRHPDGAEVVFTVRQLGMSDEELDRDAATVAADLARLRDQVEALG